jgi:hypothetical protein
LGLWVQYFDNARLEWHAGNYDPHKVQLGLLADILGHNQPRVVNAGSGFFFGGYLYQYFDETGHSASLAFLDYFRRNGGLSVFGYPVTEPMEEGGRVVQYFQRMRLEWHPERVRNDRIRPGELGLEYIYRFGLPAGVRLREGAHSAIGGVGDPVSANARKLTCLVTVDETVVRRGEQQTVFVKLGDTFGEPVAGADVLILVRNSIETSQFPPLQTDEVGIATLPFVVDSSLPVGEDMIVQVEVQALIDDVPLTCESRALFSIWY